MPVEASAGVDAAVCVKTPACIDARPEIPGTVVAGSVITGIMAVSVIPGAVIAGSVIPAPDVTSPRVDTTGTIISAAPHHGTAVIDAAARTSDGCPSDAAIGYVSGGLASVKDRPLGDRTAAEADAVSVAATAAGAKSANITLRIGYSFSLRHTPFLSNV